MSYPFIDTIANMFYQVFGGYQIVALIIIGVIALILLSIGAGRTVLMIAIIPVVVIFATQPSMFVSIPRWVGIIFWIILGIIAFFAISRLVDS